MSKANLKKVSDADLSSAGDDFHVKWAIKKSLELLNFDERGLKAVCLEGIENNDALSLDPTGEKFLGIDLCEYYGGKDFETAHTIVISQIKYSTRRINEPFTYSELYEGKKSGSYKGSIIDRLASILKPFLEKYGRDAVIQKVKIKLVSNREVNSNHLSQINQIQGFLNRNIQKLQFTDVLKNFPRISSNPYSKIRTASELNDFDFTDFIRILDFEDCGTNSRAFLKLELNYSISKISSIKSKNQYDSLFQIIWSTMQPENTKKRLLTYIDVVAEFEFSCIQDLFPVSQDFDEIPNSIPREQIKDILDLIEENKSFYPICLHGGAGYGKTTIVNQIKESLPEYCECILFDSYGKGKYTEPQDKRHLHRNAIMQIANQMAQYLGSDLLLIRNQSDDVYLRELIKRIKQTVSVLKGRNERSYLTLIIDAADNSISAAQSSGDKSFVQDLLKIGTIEGFSLIVTTRSHRKDLLDLPTKYLELELAPFSIHETSLYLNEKVQNVSKDQALEFHKLTYGVPRVQSELLFKNDVKTEINEIIATLKPDGKNIHDLIYDKILIVKRRLGPDLEDKIDQFFNLLIEVPRPVPVTYLAAIMNVDAAFIRDMASEIWRGLILEKDLFSFRDEDFENYIRDNFSPSNKDKLDIARFFLSKADVDEYSSINLVNMLFRAGCNEELIDITLNRKFLDFPKDHIRNKAVYLERVRIALKVSQQKNDELTYFKLLFIAAEEAKSDKVINDLLINFPDFIQQFGDEKALLNLKLNSEEKPWAGPFYLKLSSMNSRILGNEDVSINYFKIAQDWLQWRNKQKDDSEVYRNCSISNVDIANESEVILRLRGVEKCLNALNRWTPIEARIKAGEVLFENVIRYSNPDRVNEWLEYSNFNLFEKLFLVCNLFKFSRSIDDNTNKISEELLVFLSKPKLKLRLILREYVLQFCRILALHSIDKSLILEILDRIDIVHLERIPSFYKGYHDENLLHFKNNLSKIALVHSIEQTEIKIEYCYPKKFINSEQIKDYKKGETIREEKNEFDIFYRHLIPIYALISDIYVGGTEHSAYYKRLQVLIKNLNDDYRFDHHVGYRSSDRKLFLIERYTEVAVLLENKEEAVSYVCEGFVSQKNIMQIRFAILDIIVNHVDLNQISMRMLNEQDLLIKASNMSSQQLIESYSDCLTSSSKIDVEFSHYFLEQILHAANEVDMEAFDKINCIASLSEIGLSSPNPKLAFEFARFIEYSDVKLEGYEKKHFPYIAGLKGIANFDKSSVLSTMCRLHHRNIIKINQRITPILIHLLKFEYLDHIVVSSLLPIISYYYYPDEIGELYKIVCSKFDDNADSINKTKFVKSEFRNLRLDRDNNGITNLYESIKSGRFIERKLLKEIENYLEFQNQLKGNYADSSPRIIEKDDFSHGLDLTDFDYTTTDNLEKAIREIILLNSTDHRFRFYVEDFLIDVISLPQHDQYLPFLNALIEIDIELLDFYTFEKVLEKAITDWDYYPSLEAWKRDNFKHILYTRFDHFNAHYGFLVGSLKKFAILFEIDDDFLAECIYEILPKKLDLLTDESIYALTNLVKSKLTAESNVNLITWALNRWNANIPIGFADGIWDQKVKSPENPDENVANFIRFLLGHPDKSLRWRSIHSIRRMVNHGNVKILSILLEKQNARDCLPFQNKAYMFYWMSAKLYLWIAIDRISLENPKSLVCFKDHFFKELINEDLPHVLIRHFIKKSCLNLLSFDNSIYTKEEIQRLNDVNISKKGYKERDRDRKGNNERDELVFTFDSMDTLTYWYDPLGRLFDVSGSKVAEIADKIISEKWGYVSNIRDDDYIKDQLDENAWFSTQNRQGSNPEIEDLQTYFEYHAMYCAASKLLDEQQLVEDEWRTWEYWLDSEANKYSEFWISDLRDPLPLRKDLWKDEVKNFDEDWKLNIVDDYFDSNIFMNDEQGNSSLCVYGDIDKNIGKVTERIDISSCLIPAENDEEVLKSLQATKNHYDYYFPTEKSELEDQDNINGNFFEPWLKNISSDFEGLDKHDPYVKDIAKWIISLDDNISEKYGIAYDHLNKVGYIGSEEISYFENWHEISDDSYKRKEYSNALETSGKLLKVNFNFILRFLKNEKKSLLIRCIIKREIDDKRDWHLDNREDIDNRNEVKLYLVNESRII